MKQKFPFADVDTVLAAFRDTGTSVDDQRSGGIETDMRRINIDQALVGSPDVFTIFNDGGVQLDVTGSGP